MVDLNTTEPTVRCHCLPLHQCPNRNLMCVSTTGCFHSLLLDTSLQYVVTEHRGCFPNHTNQVDLHCREPPLINPLVYCCSAVDGDYCNLNLAPHLPRSRLAALFSLSDNIMLIMAFLLPLGTLLCGLVAIGLFWQCVLRKRLERHSLPVGLYPRYCSRTRRNTILSAFLSKYLSCFREGKVDLDRCSEGQQLALSCVDKPRELISCTSGSGSGLPFLVQRTIARHVQLEMCIGKGRFGEVWRALCQGELVAVKIFSSRDESSWARETEVYNAGLLHHPNLLAYYASDMISRGGCTQLWLITAYHQHGSLHDYLSHETLSLSDSFRLARSIAAGLAFLHTEIRGFQSKPAIVHRDIKSKNVLVRDDKEACIADLGLALLQPKFGNGISGNFQTSRIGCDTTSGATESYHLGLSSPGAPQPAGPRVGTKRYMSPELLMAVEPLRSSVTVYPDSSLELSGENLLIGTVIPYLPFEVYQAADVYAMSLVFWELLRCTRGSDKNNPSVEGYQIPYQDMVPTDPTFSQMRSVVCDNYPEDGTQSTDDVCSPADQKNTLINGAISVNHGRRPPISDRWLDDPYLLRATHIIQECWHWNWSSRLPALRVRKNLEVLESSLVNLTRDT
ncbi:Activin receptor type-1 [Clonorchis sinensis]|uniref:receptor protein serine/threonine kinase n=1 Tax=Clonorchis sinensis TaxID=79923 RepID=A0A3R7G326_CLOSI|nr:Activin receptor type-1 [Clonorchis sinensis]